MSYEKVNTGTTCIGMKFKDGIILAADRRMTAGYVASDRAEKVYKISKSILATTAGHASDNQFFMRIISGELKLIELKNERKVRVREAAMILNSMQYKAVRTQGSVVSLIVGGYDEKEKFSLYNLSPDGTIVPHDNYIADGSGSIYVKSVLDNEYKYNMSEKEALALVEKAFWTSFKNDIHSGGGYVANYVNADGDVKEISRKIIDSKFVDEKKNGN